MSSQLVSLVIFKILNADIRFDQQTDTFMYEIDQI